MATAVAPVFEIEVLHALHGDKKKQITNPADAAKFVRKMLREGTAIFLERGKKCYIVTGYDDKKNRLLVRVEKKGKQAVAAKPEKGRKTAVPPRAGG